MQPKKPICGTLSLAVPIIGGYLTAAFGHLLKLNDSGSITVFKCSLLLGLTLGGAGLWRREFFWPLPALGVVLNLAPLFFWRYL